MKRKLKNRGADIKLALVTEPLFKHGGAEYHIKEILNAFPNAEIYTAFHDPKFTSEYYPKVKIHSSFMQYLPNKIGWRYFYLLFQPLAYRSFNFRGKDIVLSISMAFAKFVRLGKGVKHVAICMTPPKYLWEKGGRTLVSGDRFTGFLKVMYSIYSFFMDTVLEKIWKGWDRKAAQRCTKIIAISNVVKDRVKKYYDLDADVIYPPVDVAGINKMKAKNRKENWFLYVGRVETYKGVKLAIKSCVKAGVPLKIVGKGDDLEAMQELVRKLNAKGEVKFLGYVSEEEKYDLMSRAKALIFPVRHEDFGIVPVEANACGTPVIAYREGGVLESISENNPKTGVFFDRYDVKTLATILSNFKSLNYDPDNCKKQASNFASEIFVYKLQNYIKDVLQEG